MLLITSGAYIEDALISELGLIPPCFLPAGNKRLFQLQVESLGQLDLPIYMSVPEGFLIKAADKKLIDQLKISIIRVPEGLSLGNSILYCWNSTGVNFDSIKIYHGDTLLYGQDLLKKDIVSVDRNDGFYERASFADLTECRESALHEEGGEVLSGYFSLSKPEILFKGVIESKGSFIKGLSYYHKQIGLTKSRSEKWLDFGHLNSFFQSRMGLTTERSFNSIHITKRNVTKKSINENKINAEANWFHSIPDHIKYYTPRLIDWSSISGSSFYKIEYLYLLPLSDMFVFGKLGAKTWERIFSCCKDLIDELGQCLPAPGSQGDFSHCSLFLQKTVERLNSIGAESGIDPRRKFVIDGKFMDMFDVAEDSCKYIPQLSEEQLTLIHGDFCFSNILFDSRSNSLKLVDPRGVDSKGRFTIYGDPRYDLAKLFHSVIGMYDYIIVGYYLLENDLEGGPDKILFHEDETIQRMQQSFLDIFFKDGSWSLSEILAININLFLSMIPLHSDFPERQKAMFANAIRLYRKLMGLTK